LATALVARSWVAAGRGELDTARVDVEHSLALFRDIGDRWGQARAGELLGYLLEVEGDYDRAAQLHREGLRLATELGLWPIASRQLGRLGRLAALAGDYPAAIERYEQALALATEIGFRQGVTFAHGGLGTVVPPPGPPQGGRAALPDHARHPPRGGLPQRCGIRAAHLGFIAAARADTTTARALQREGLAGARELGDQRAVAFAVEGLADAEAAAGEHERAAELLGQAARIRTDAGRPLPPAERVDVDRVAAAARTALGELAFEAAFARGTAQTSTVNPCQHRETFTR
jgi:tetratricopeptide (TPR) repeat protein